MVDENKVKVMTHLAIYEKHNAKSSVAVSKYYKNDYIRYNTLKTWVAVTVAFWSIVVAYVYMNFDKLLAEVNGMDYFDIMYRMLGGYVAVCAIYFVIAMFLYNYRYEKVRPGLAWYNSKLRDIIELQGGPVHHKKTARRAAPKTDGKKSTGTRIKEAINEAEVMNDPFAAPARRQYNSDRINKVELFRIREMEAQRDRELLIKENIKRRNERLAAQNAEKQRRQQQYEANKKAMQEKRRQLELKQMEQIKAESLQRMKRQNHSYNSDSEED